MLTYKDRHNDKAYYMSFRCRMCKTALSNPEELRLHSMAKHKGHMILAIKT